MSDKGVIQTKATVYRNSDTGKIRSKIAFPDVAHCDRADILPIAQLGGFSLADIIDKVTSVNIRDKFKNMDRRHIMIEALIMYDQYGTVRAICDTTANFIATSYSYIIDESKDKTGRISKFWERYYKTLKIRKLINQMVLDILRSGNTFCLKSEAPYEPMFDRFNKINDKSVVDTYTGKIVSRTDDEYRLWTDHMAELEKRSIPVRFDVMRPSGVEVVGEGLGGWRYKVTLTTEAFKAMHEAQKNILGLPPVMFESIRRSDGPTLMFTPGEMIHLAYKKQDYEDYGLPFWWGAAATIQQKSDMIENDEEMQSSQMKNAWTITAGNDEFPASKGQLENLANLFGHGIEPRSIYFWNHTLDVKPIKQEFMSTPKETYDVIDEQLFNEMGFPAIFAGGMTGSTFSNAAYQIMPLEQFVNDFQNMLQNEFLEPFHEYVSQQMGFRAIPQGRFARNALKDQNAFQKMLLQWWDRGIYLLDQLADSLGTTDAAVIDQTTRVQGLMEEGKIPLFLGGSPYNSPKDENGNPTEPPKNRPSDDVKPEKISGRPQRKLQK